MKATRLALPDVVMFEPTVFSDHRGVFFESFSSAAFTAATGLERKFPQDNHSVSRKGVIRGLHYQVAPFAQGKLVRVVKGAAFDVAVDLRRGSPTFGRWVAETLTADNLRQLWIPEGFAHGFLALAEDTTFLYKATSIYDRASERSLLWNDAALAIEWPICHDLTISDKDALAPILRTAECFI